MVPLLILILILIRELHRVGWNGVGCDGICDVMRCGTDLPNNPKADPNLLLLIFVAHAFSRPYNVIAATPWIHYPLLYNYISLLHYATYRSLHVLIICPLLVLALVYLESTLA